MTRNILITAVNLIADIDRYRPLFQDHDLQIMLPPKGEPITEDVLSELVRDADGIIAGDEPFSGRVLENATHLRVISRWGTGLDNIDLEACQKVGIVVKNIPGVFTEPVADLVLAFMLAFARQIPRADQQVRAGRWASVPARTLQECTLGVIGVGTIGKAVIRRVAGFNMTLLGHDVKPIPEELIKQTGLQSVSKDDLLRRADFVSLNCDLNPTSYHIIGEDELAMMKPEAVLINTSRGGVVDEKALAQALREERIAGAGLDVFEHEPLPDDSPLREMENVLLSPHNGHSSPMTREKAHQRAIENLLAGLNDG